MYARRQLFAALLNFLLAATVGALLRFIYIAEIPGLVYKNALHAHSHLALLGWAFLGVFTLIEVQLLTDASEGRTLRRRLFWGCEAAVLIMFAAFLIQGYGVVAIVCSTLFLVSAGLFTGSCWKALRGSALRPSVAVARPFIQTAIVFLGVSALGIMVIGPSKALGSAGLQLYYMGVQMFLHFQFNGWFTFALLGLGFDWAARRGITFEPKTLLRFRWLLTLSTVLTYALAVSWMDPDWYIYAVNTLGSLLHLAAGVAFFQLIRPQHKRFLFVHPASRLAFNMALISFFIKFLFISTCAVPYIAQMALTVRNYVIGFVHLLTLGVITLSILSLALEFGVLLPRRPIVVGIKILLAGFISVECFLFLQGLLLWFGFGFFPYYHLLVFIFTLLLPTAVGILLYWSRNPSQVPSVDSTNVNML